MTPPELERIDREHYWHAFTQMAEYVPLIVDRAEGVWLFDVQGRRLLDGASSMWCNVHGHRHPRIDAAIRQQLDRVAHVSSLGLSNPTAIELTRRLVDVTPDGLECVFFSSDGSSAVEAALKMAFQYWRQCADPQPQRDRFLAIGNAYHGDTLGSVSVGDVPRFHAAFDPLRFEVLRGPCPDTYRLPAGVSEDQAKTHYLNEYAKLLERFGDRIVAIILEPVIQGAAGIVKHPVGFLRGLRELANRYGILLIADEIAVGMGRTGKLWACELEGVSPDFLCSGKGLSGGYVPLAATLTTRKVWEAFLGTYSQSRTFFHGHTFGGNALACAAGVATLQLFDEENTLRNVAAQGDLLERCLQPLRAHPHIGDVRRVGLLAAIELVSDKVTRAGFPWEERRGHRVCQAALSRGVWLRPLGDVIVLIPPLCAQAEHIELLVEAVRFGVESSFG